MPFQIIRNDITRVKADVIVNTANPHPAVGSGVDGAVYAAAGEQELLAERRKIGEIARGDAAVTPAFGLSARYIIHTVGPAWIDGEHGERETLRSCYAKSLKLADELQAESIAFPLIATGVYGFPKDEALEIATSEIGKFLLTHEMLVTMVVFDQKAFQLSKKLTDQIDEYIDEHGFGQAWAKEYHDKGLRYDYTDIALARRNWAPQDYVREQAPLHEGDNTVYIHDKYISGFDVKGKTLEEVLEGAGKSFQQRLFELIDEKGMTDPAVYTKANIDRKLFSNIRCKKNYRPKKKTAVALAIALELDMPATQDLLARAGYTLSPSNLSDLIVSYFVENRKYDIMEINIAMEKYGQELLGNPVA